MFNLISALEAANRSIAAAQTPQGINDAYAHLSVCRKAVYAGLSRIEQLAGVEQTTILRF